MLPLFNVWQFSLEFIGLWRTSEFSGGSFHPKENVDHPKPTTEMVAQLGPFKVPGITEHLDYIKGTLVLCSYAVDSGIPAIAVFVVVSYFKHIQIWAIYSDLSRGHPKR